MLKNNFESHAIATLKSHGYRITMPRVLVVRALAEASVALDPYRIHDAVTQSGGKIDVVSVYRILDALQDCGLVYKVGLLDGKYWRKLDPDNKCRVLRVNLSTGQCKEPALTDGNAQWKENLLALADGNPCQFEIEAPGISSSEGAAS